MIYTCSFEHEVLKLILFVKSIDEDSPGYDG